MTEPHDPADALIGTVLGGRYRILERLGVGAMGAVYLGEHLKIGRLDAIKVLRDSLATDREAALRFLRGARNVSAIRHPNVCTIYDFSDTADGLQFMAMELVSGETLKDVLDRMGRLPPERAAHIAAQTAEALQAAHDAGIVHRDLKPGNIMLGKARDGRDMVKVVDFDIAKAAEADGEEVTRTGFVVGTPEYMSPEQLMGEHLDGRSDVYSLALVLFRMLAGGLPFRAESTQDVMIQRLTHRPLRLDEAVPGAQFPERLQHALDRALERRAADRWPSAAAFGREIVAAISSPAAWSSPAAAAALPAGTEELAPTRVGPPAPAQPMAGTAAAPATGRSRRNVAIAAATLLVVALGAAALMLGDGAPGAAQPGAADPAATDAAPASALAAADSVAAPETAQTPPGPAGTPPREERREPAGPAGRPETARAAPPAATAMAIPTDRVEAMLFDLLDRLPPIADAAPGAAAFAAMIDTARAVYDMSRLRPADRALAAYVLGTAFDARADWPRCAAWMDSALALNPGGGVGYTTLRTKCRELIR